MDLVGSGWVSRDLLGVHDQYLTLTFLLAFLYAVEILPLQYRSQVQSGSNLVFWFVAFLAVYFGGQAASDPNVGALIYIWFCLGGGIITILSWFFVVESKLTPNPSTLDGPLLTPFN